jgi:hypothetical protein
MVLGISRHAALRAAQAAIELELKSTSPFDDWLEQCLVRGDQSDRFDQDDAFVSFFEFARLTGAGGEHRLAHSAFVSHLEASGLRAKRVGSHVFRYGGALSDPFRRVSAPGISLDIAQFVRTCCQIGGDARQDRGKSAEIYGTYCAWARTQGREAISHQQFNKSLKSRGFRKKKSDGIWWIGLRLRKGLALGLGTVEGTDGRTKSNNISGLSGG